METATGAAGLGRIIAACTLALITLKLFSFIGMAVHRRASLRHIPVAPGCVPLLGHILSLINHPLPWEAMHDWVKATDGNMVRWCLPFEDWVVVRGGSAMRAVFQTKFRDFHKEMAMSFHPFLCILGSGLVTSHGDLWQKQRKLMTPAFKGDILQEVIGISVRAVDRLAIKLRACCDSKETVELDEEFRLLTLQVQPTPGLQPDRERHTPCRAGVFGATDTAPACHLDGTRSHEQPGRHTAKFSTLRRKCQPLCRSSPKP